MIETGFEYSHIAIKVRELAGVGKRIVFVSGNFNTVHPGHLRLLRFAKECGDFLVIGVMDVDPKAGILLKEIDRLEGIKAISFVDYAFILRTSPEIFIRELKPAIVVKGKEYEIQQNSEKNEIESYGGKLLFSSGEMRFSSIDLLKQEILGITTSSLSDDPHFCEKHQFAKADLAHLLHQFKGLRVLILGDLIVDEYITCDPVGMSQEDPTLVVTPIQHEKFIGGAAIVAAHAKQLGADVRYITVAGKDESADFARQKLHRYGVDARIFEDESRPTILKQRYRASSKTLLRVSYLKQHEISQEIEQQCFKEIESLLPQIDLVIFSDFNYGFLTHSLIEKVTLLCQERKILMTADSQSSSQMGDVSRFKEVMLLTPTEREARLAMHDFKSGLVVLAEKLRKKTGAKNIVLTLGAEGLLTHASSVNGEDYFTDRLPAFNRSPRDAAGAGDSFLTCCSLALAVGADIWKSVYLGSLAAACQVGRVGNIPLTIQDMMDVLKEIEAS